MLMELGGECNYKFNEVAQFSKMLLAIQLFWGRSPSLPRFKINLIKLSGYQINNAICSHAMHQHDWKAFKLNFPNHLRRYNLTKCIINCYCGGVSRIDKNVYEKSLSIASLDVFLIFSSTFADEKSSPEWIDSAAMSGVQSKPICQLFEGRTDCL